MASPLDWQIPGIEANIAVLRKHKAALEASGTGYGKTYVACFVAQKFGLPIAVVCPKAVIPAWIQAARDVGVEAVFVTNWEAVKSSKFRWGHWKRRNQIWEWDLPHKTLLVFDEVHKAKTRTSQNAKLLAATVRWPGPVLMMSATAAENPGHLWAIGGVLGLHKFSDFWSWAYDYGYRRGTFGFEFVGSSQDLFNMHAKIFPEHGHRIRVQDIPGFPRNKIETLPIDVSNVAKFALLMEKLEELEERKANDSLEGGELTELLRARQEAELMKAPAIVDLAIELVDQGHSVPIFVNFRDTLDLIWDGLFRAKVRTARIHGGQDPEDREDHRQIFQADKARAIVCMIQAGGVGIDLHDITGRHPRVSLISPGFNAVELKQALGRSCRAGGKTPTVQRIVFAADTIEERVRRKVGKKLANIDSINDGDLSLL